MTEVIVVPEQPGFEPFEYFCEWCHHLRLCLDPKFDGKWCLDELMIEVRSSLNVKVLEESKIHLIKVKVGIAQVVCDRARMMIVSGAKPK